MIRKNVAYLTMRKTYRNVARIKISENLIIVMTGTKRLGQTFHALQQLKTWKRQHIFSVLMMEVNLVQRVVWKMFNN